MLADDLNPPVPIQAQGGLGLILDRAALRSEIHKKQQGAQRGVHRIGLAPINLARVYYT